MWKPVARQIRARFDDLKEVTPVEPTHLYFAYGSNLNRADMRVRCPEALPAMPARLEGWRLAFRGVADIEPAERRTAYGALWSLTAEDLNALDRYEGAPSLYARQFVEVQTADGPAAAMTYVMTESSYLGLPSAWYLERIATGYRDFELPSAALHEAVTAAHDELLARGFERFRPDGRKRLRALPGR